LNIYLLGLKPPAATIAEYVKLQGEFVKKNRREKMKFSAILGCYFVPLGDIEDHVQY